MDDASTREIYETERPKDAIADYKKRITELEAACDRAWEISMLAQAFIDNGEGYATINEALVEIAEACALALKR